MSSAQLTTFPPAAVCWCAVCEDVACFCNSECYWGTPLMYMYRFSNHLHSLVCTLLDWRLSLFVHNIWVCSKWLQGCESASVTSEWMCVCVCVRDLYAGWIGRTQSISSTMVLLLETCCALRKLNQFHLDYWWQMLDKCAAQLWFACGVYSVVCQSYSLFLLP